jgi:outer membrane protein OmpU
MKKSLLATTAMAALCAVAVAGPASAAENIKIGVGGYMEQWFGFADNKESLRPDRSGFDQQSDGEIHFKGSTTLDNGLKIGVNVQLEAQTDGDTIDEQYAYVQGSFGRVLLGSENAANYLMHYGIPSHGVTIDSGDHASWIANYDFTSGRTNGRGIDNDSEKLTFITPRFQGFQVGASYVPELAQDSDNGPSGVDNTRDNGFAVAANFMKSFNDVKVMASAGFMDFGSDSGAFTQPTDLDSYSVGLRLGTAGFTIAGTYGKEDRVGPQLNAAGVAVGTQGKSGTQETVGLGVSYAGGPFAVSLAYIGSERSNTQEEQDAFELGAKYKLGPGIDVRGSLLYAEGKDLNGADEVDGIAIVGGLKLGF